METLQQKFELYLIENHKDEFEKYIAEQIELAKTKPFYKARRSRVKFDCSLEIFETDSTIGDVCKDEYEILNSFTGEKIATFLPGHGFDHVTVGDDISKGLESKVEEIIYKFVEKNYNETIKEVEYEIDIDDNIDARELAEIAIEYGILSYQFCTFYINFNPGGLWKKLIDRDDYDNEFNIEDEDQDF